MMQKQKGKYVFECDGCNDTNDTDKNDFYEAREKLKDDEWKVVFDDGTWYHYCPSCAKSIMRK